MQNFVPQLWLHSLHRFLFLFFFFLHPAIGHFTNRILTYNEKAGRILTKIELIVGDDVSSGSTSSAPMKNVLTLDYNAMRSDKVTLEREVRKNILSRGDIILHSYVVSHDKKRYIYVRKRCCFVFIELPSNKVMNFSSIRSMCLYDAVFTSLKSVQDYIHYSEEDLSTDPLSSSQYM
jgi:hypothetical protein